MKKNILNKGKGLGEEKVLGKDQRGAGRMRGAKKQLNPILLVLFVLSFFISSCEDVIDVKLNEENLNLTGVEAYLTTLDDPTVFVYRTLKVNQDEAYPGISNAVVIISDDATPSNQITLIENDTKKGLYHVPQNTGYHGVAGREYTVTIKTPEATLVAKDKLNAVEPIDSIQVVPSMRGDKRFLGVFTYGKEPKGIGNYYKWDVFINDTLVNKAENLAIASDEFVDGNYISKLEIFTDFHDINKPKDRKLKFNDTVYVKQTSISEFDYNFYFQMIIKPAPDRCSVFPLPILKATSPPQTAGLYWVYLWPVMSPYRIK